MNIEVSTIPSYKPSLNASLDAPTIAYFCGRHGVIVFGSSVRDIFAVSAAGKVTSLHTVCFNCPVFGISPNVIGR